MNVKNTTILHVHLLFVVLIAPLSTTAQSHSEQLHAGLISPKVTCTTEPSESYAMYLPSNYSVDQDWPIIFLFDPMARGLLPVKLYAPLAEERGYILVCSNNSRNGAVSQSINSFHMIKSDIEQRLSIAADRVYTSGFSGGGRLAQYLASTEADIAGVIAIAGPKLDEKNIRRDYLYYGIVGNLDMNYVEHYNFQKELNEKKMSNRLLIYPAPHQWATTEAFGAAMDWMEIQYRLDTKLTIKAEELESYAKRDIQLIDTMNSVSIAEKYNYLSTLQKSLIPYESIALDTKIEQLNQSKELSKCITKTEKSIKRELQNYHEISTALYQLKISSYDPDIPIDSTDYPMSWWKIKIKDLQIRVKREDEKGRTAERTLDVIRGQVFGVLLQSESDGNLEFKMNLIRIQRMLYPESVWILWNQAIVFAKMDHQKYALDCLKKARLLDGDQLYALKKKQSELAEDFPYLFE